MALPGLGFGFDPMDMMPAALTTRSRVCTTSGKMMKPLASLMLACNGGLARHSRPSPLILQ